MPIVTKDMLDQLRAQRDRPQLKLDYTIGGTTETAVATYEAAKREKKIAQGEHTLKEALEEMRTQQTFASRNGLAKAHFNHNH